MLIYKGQSSNPPLLHFFFVFYNFGSLTLHNWTRNIFMMFFPRSISVFIFIYFRFLRLELHIYVFFVVLEACLLVNIVYIYICLGAMKKITYS